MNVSSIGCAMTDKQANRQTSNCFSREIMSTVDPKMYLIFQKEEVHQNTVNFDQQDKCTA